MFGLSKGWRMLEWFEMGECCVVRGDWREVGGVNREIRKVDVDL